MKHSNNLKHVVPKTESDNDGLEEEATEKKLSFTANCFEWAEALITSLVVVVILFTFVFRIVNVSGPSMMDTLMDKDKVVLTNMYYDPQPGDIVVVTHAAHMNQPIVKRIIAVGGQTLKIDFDTGEVFVDGVLLHEPYIKSPTIDPEDNIVPSVVPDGYVFVMGDNRGNSLDSRSTQIGLIDERNILGKVQYIVFPFSRAGGLYS